MSGEPDGESSSSASGCFFQLAHECAGPSKASKARAAAASAAAWRMRSRVANAALPSVRPRRPHLTPADAAGAALSTVGRAVHAVMSSSILGPLRQRRPCAVTISGRGRVHSWVLAPALAPPTRQSSRTADQRVWARTSSTAVASLQRTRSPQLRRSGRTSAPTRPAATFWRRRRPFRSSARFSAALTASARRISAAERSRTLRRLSISSARSGPGGTRSSTHSRRRRRGDRRTLVRSPREIGALDPELELRVHDGSVSLRKRSMPCPHVRSPSASARS